MTKIESDIIAVLDNGPKTIQSLLDILQEFHSMVDTLNALLPLMSDGMVILDEGRALKLAWKGKR